MAAKDNALALETYRGLVKRVRETLILGQKRIEALKVETYWDTGFFINEHLRRNEARAEYGKQVLLRLSRDTGLHRRVFERCARFAEKFPNFKIPAGRPELPATPRQIEKVVPRKTLNWTHYRALLTIEDAKRRLALEAKALEKDWTSEELEEKISRQNRRARKIKRTELLNPKRGTVGLFQIIEDSGALHWDKGFASYEALSAKEKEHFKQGDLVVKGARGLTKASGAKPSELYTYEADLLKVVDADTFWMRIWLDRPRWIKEKLRLRGIDAPERGTPEGERAIRFVKEQFEKAVKITITTTKPDKWDRYLSDVFLLMPPNLSRSRGLNPGYESEEGEEIFLNNLLLEKGLATRYGEPQLEDWE